MDLQKYSGKWFEIYKQNADFASFCGISTAEYTLLPNGSLKVLNKCYTKNGEYITEISGIASPTNVYNILNLKFDNLPKISEYTIFYTDYNYSIVGNLDNNYFSILARTPSIQYLDVLLDKAKGFGFKINC